MNLQTIIPIKASDRPIDYQSRLLLLGSCFAEHIGQKFDHFKFRSLANPFGILFHPVAIANLVSRALKEETYSEEELFFLDDRWHCFDAHSLLSDGSKERLLQKLNNALEQTRQQITGSTHILITLGTAWVYHNIGTGQIVANCHKVPQKEFVKELLSVEDISKNLAHIIEQVRSANPKARFIFTISPVRHLKDGFVENQLSKSRLVSALHDVLGVPLLGARGLGYFPSYELMMDELRDYRFYERDMVHPNPLAIDYIWERFKETWISEKTYPVMEQVEAVQKGLGHRPFNPGSAQHQKFARSLEEKITYLKEQYPHMIFDL